MSALVVVPRPMNASLPLYEIEETLAVFAETEEVVLPEQEAEFLQEFAAIFNSAVEKRDSMGQFMAHLEVQIGLADAEIRRLQDRKQAYTRALAKSEEYVIRVIQSLGTDGKGKYKKLEGNTVTFSLKHCPPSVSITDETRVPPEFKTATLTLKMPALQWEALLDTLDLEARARLLDGAKVEYTPSKTAIKAALEAQNAVPGAAIVTGKYSLIRK
jgi:hypothetical protein